MDTPNPGYVYVLQMEGHDYYKIGRTSNPDRRIRQIRPQMPARLKVVFAHRVSDCHFWESQLHFDYKSKRLNGEWFLLDSLDLQRIETRLLASQAEWFLWFIAERFQDRIDSLSLPAISKYGRVISLSARRADRRISRVFDLHDRYQMSCPAIIADMTFEGVVG